MTVGIGIIFVLISLLLFTYYRTYANENDYNRPSFFNSKGRKYFLVLCMITFFICSNFLFIQNKNYHFIYIVPLFYFVAVSYLKKQYTKYLAITKTLYNYRVLRQPDFSFSNKDRVTMSVEMVFLMTGLSKEHKDRMSIYLKKRYKEGFIKGPKDLPQETWTIIQCLHKDKIEPIPEIKLSDKQINYYYEEIIEGKEHHNFMRRFFMGLNWAEVRLERMFNNFAFIKLAREDFTSQEVCLQDIEETGKDDDKEPRTISRPVFPEIPVGGAVKFGWVKDRNEYFCLAALEYQRRFPKQKFSKFIKKQHKYTNQQILDYAQNWEKLDVDKIKLS